ncbi:uncharacterized protein N7515_003832 [Penicillium bovifimosum]|uniref:Uncharacterized protein n=1 Tax=Penicillium bovifimosum TaxID=126998 RepID=A0A9W9H5H2_9EURO|nr:uncharacterized protein N7515_003832 [Penicillium bovifimosum]KAJ5138984.1 hypothetical protein N7515_003832 [Penicillium bovifimosum]
MGKLQTWSQKHLDSRITGPAGGSVDEEQVFVSSERGVQDRLEGRDELFWAPLRKKTAAGPCDGSEPWEYLAIALVESSSLSIDEIRDKIYGLVKLKDGAQRFLATMPLAEAIMKNDNVARHRHRFFETARRFRNRLGSLSPRGDLRGVLPPYRGYSGQSDFVMKTSSDVAKIVGEGKTPWIDEHDLSAPG